MDSSLVISVIASAVLTPLIVLLWAKITPVTQHSEFDQMGADRLRARNKWLDRAFTLLMFVGLLVPFLVMHKLGSVQLDLRVIGLAFGNMVVLPTAFVAAITLPSGIGRFHEFWRYYERKWGIGLKGIAWVYGLLTLVWGVCLVRLLVGI